MMEEFQQITYVEKKKNNCYKFAEQIKVQAMHKEKLK